MKASDLIKALEDGKTVSKIHYDDPEYKETVTMSRIQYNEQKELYTYIYCKGWGSSIGQPRERLVDMILNPEKWNIE